MVIFHGERARLIIVLEHSRITGAAFNPSVSLALFLVGGIGTLRFLLYVVAQLVGGIVATAILHGLLPGPIAFACAPGPGVTLAQATLIELVLTASVSAISSPLGRQL